jgi:O-antigen ligase
MKLTESDVRAMANNRYWTKKRVLYLFGVVLGVLILALVVMAATKSNWAILVYLIAFVYIVVELWRAGKFQKELVRQWKADQL